MSHYDCKECHQDPVSGCAPNCTRGRALESATETRHRIQALANRPTERALVEALKALCAHFEAQNPMRTADLHPTVCNCIRCDYDRAAALLAALKAHGETVG